MDTRTGSFSIQRTYDDFVPPQRLIEEPTADTLLLELAGFRKEHIKVQIDNYGKLRISGERPVGGNKWVRFRKEHQCPENCNFNGIRAKYENGLVSITLPKVVTPPVPAPDETKAQAIDKPASQQNEPSQQPKVDGEKKKEVSDVSGVPTSGEKIEEKRSEPAVDRPAIDGEKKKKEEELPKEDTSKAAYEAMHESSEEGKDSSSESESEEEEMSSDGRRLGMLKEKMGGLWTCMHKSRKAIWITFAVLVVSIGVGLMINYKLNDNAMQAPMISVITNDM